MKAHFLDRGSFPSHIKITPPDSLSSWQAFDRTNADQTIAHCQNAEIILTNKVVISRQHIEQLPHLKLIGVTATGTNNVDLEACRDAGIKVVNATDYGTQSVAEHVLMLMLSLARNLPTYLDSNHNKSWSNSAFFCDWVAPIRLLHNRTLTIIGHGTLGKAVARLATAFNMKIVIAEHRGAQKTRPGYTPFELAISQADFLSLHCPLTSATENLINRETLGLMKPSAFLVNTGRGPLVNEQDLLTVLQQGQIAGVALDVTAIEPPPNDSIIWQLNTLPNVIITPHIAWAADEAMQNLIDQIMTKIDLFIARKPFDELTNKRS